MKPGERIRGALVAAVFAVVLSLAAPTGGAQAAEGDDQLFTFLQIEQFEYRMQDGTDLAAWDAEGWIGEDYNKLWVKTEGEQPIEGKLESAEVQVLYSRLVSDFFDVQAGLRQDFAPTPERTFAVLGLQGLAPYFFEVDAAAFVSDRGELSARLKGEYELLFSQRLILQPSLEVNWSGETIEEREIGAGFTDIEAGLRLRYEIVREFAPYIGVNWERKLGTTADLAREEGERTESVSLVAGLRFWF